ncbi:MAG TPA: hypothetical protein VF818_00765 [Ktedonobacterales bacterium]
MSQMLLPPHSPSDADTPGVAATATPPVVDALSPRPGYTPEPPRPPSRFWRAVKWPLRTLFKAIYLTSAAANRHRIITLTALGILLAFGGVTYGVYHFTHPTAATSSSGGAASQSAVPGGDTPLTIVSQTPPPLPPSVLHWLHGHKIFDAHEMWSGLSPSTQANLTQQGVSESALQAQLDNERAQGKTYEQYIYTGGFAPLGAYANYTVQVVVDQGGQRLLTTWYFVVDQNGLIVAPIDIDRLLSGGQ